MSHAVYLIFVCVHVFSAIIWIGGMLFLSFVLVPLLKRPELKDFRSILLQSVGIRFRIVGWICLFLLIITGTGQLAYRGCHLGDFFSGLLWSGSFGKILYYKLHLVLVILVLSFLHDFWIGPKASRASRFNLDSQETRRWRLLASWAGRVNLLLSLAVIALAVMLARGI